VKKKDKITITKEDLLKVESFNRRKELIESGMYMAYPNKTHKSKKVYSRKKKHKKRDF